MRVYCDFDGTISTVDTTDLVLTRLAAPEWEALEARWVAGEITAAECMRAQVALIGGDDAELDAVLDTVELTPGFIDFAEWCEANAVPLVVVSDGVDYFIRRILARHGVVGLEVISNQLAVDATGARALAQPWSRVGCAAGSGVCKCQVAVPRAEAESMVFIGDGRSDFCVSGRADLLFAKDKLADYAHSRGVPHHVFTDFNDIKTTLSALHAGAARRAAG